MCEPIWQSTLKFFAIEKQQVDAHHSETIIRHQQFKWTENRKTRNQQVVNGSIKTKLMLFPPITHTQRHKYIYINIVCSVGRIMLSATIARPTIHTTRYFRLGAQTKPKWRSTLPVGSAVTTRSKLASRVHVFIHSWFESCVETERIYTAGKPFKKMLKHVWNKDEDAVGMRCLWQHNTKKKRCNRQWKTLYAKWVSHWYIYRFKVFIGSRDSRLSMLAFQFDMI